MQRDAAGLDHATCRGTPGYRRWDGKKPQKAVLTLAFQLAQGLFGSCLGLFGTFYVRVNGNP